MTNICSFNVIRKAASVLLAAVFLCAASFGPALAGADTDNVVIKKEDENDNVILLQMRLRDLGFYDYKVTGYFGDFTAKALKDFQKSNGITADGVAGEKTLSTLYSNSAKRKPIEPLIKPVVKKKVNVKTGNYRDWFEYVNARWKRGMKCKVIDFNTGVSYTMVRVGGQYHADVAPATKADTKKLLQTYGGVWSYARRAVVVIIGGERIAGSTNGQPHGSTGVPGNGMTDPADGSIAQVCIHFKNSRTHNHNMRDPDHQYQVKRAAGLK